MVFEYSQSRTRNLRGRVCQFGGFFLELAILLPILSILGLMVAEPLLVLHRYNKVHHELTSLVDEAREHDSLRANFWNATNSSDYQAFKSARAELSQKLKQRLGAVAGVSLEPVMHLDRLGVNEGWEELAFGYLPPGTSGYIPNWKNSDGKVASLNNSHLCGPGATDESSKSFDAAIRKGLRSVEDAVPLKSMLGARASCTLAPSLPNDLSIVSSAFPTELTAAANITGFLGSYRIALTVPFWPKVRPDQAVQSSGSACAFRGVWGAWPMSCGPVERTMEQSDGCENRRVLTESRCNGNCEWKKIFGSEGACRASPGCASGSRSIKEKDRCGTDRENREACSRGVKICSNGVGIEINRKNHRSPKDQHNTSCHWAGKNFIFEQGELQLSPEEKIAVGGTCFDRSGGSQDSSFCRTCRYYQWEDLDCNGQGALDIDPRGNGKPTGCNEIILCSNGVGASINSKSHRDPLRQCNTSCHWATDPNSKRSKNFVPSEADGGQIRSCSQKDLGCISGKNNSRCTTCRYYQWAKNGCPGYGDPGINQATGKPN